MTVIVRVFDAVNQHWRDMTVEVDGSLTLMDGTPFTMSTWVKVCKPCSLNSHGRCAGDCDCALNGHAEMAES